ncbi:MAG TPA: phosphoadenosine phosphosulfate reductase family protein, partial [Bacteroidia bacterium]|nr:phosphoadenosine phosphosulfate reductase family protein [Bacteroidia bacterium]
ARHPEISYEYIYNDTRMELPDTYAWIDKVEAVLGIKIVRLGKSLAKIIDEQKILPSPRTRYCTKYAKIYPMRDYIGKQPATLYIGIRADEERTGAHETKNMAVCYPLKEMNVNLALVYRIVESKGLLPPAFFWKRLHDTVISELGSEAWIVNELPKWIFDRTFAWRSRPNCFMCFYQRRYEWCGLLEHYPELFAEAEEIETKTRFSSDTREHPFLLIGQDIPLGYIRENTDRIVQTRVDAIVKLLRKRLQMDLFTDALLDEIEAAQTSCGLYCGK